MRKILFRGKTVLGGAWVCGDLTHTTVDKRPMIRVHGENCARNYMVDPATVGQYTGLKDRNGVRIFEGDVIKTHSGIVGLIAFGNHYDDEFGFCSNGWFFAGRDEVGDDCTLSLTDEWSSHMVIGNIHDNPELLEVHHE